MQVGPCIPVGIQTEKAKVCPTPGPTWRLSHLVGEAGEERHGADNLVVPGRNRSFEPGGSRRWEGTQNTLHTLQVWRGVRRRPGDSGAPPESLIYFSLGHALRRGKHACDHGKVAIRYRRKKNSFAPRFSALEQRTQFELCADASIHSEQFAGLVKLVDQVPELIHARLPCVPSSMRSACEASGQK